jgi:hypothetical protein
MLSMSAAFRSSDLRAHPRLVDLAALPARDRAVLRLLYRMEAATARQLTNLAYRRVRKGQYRLQQLWRLRLTERTAAATDHAGAPPYAHRLTYHVRQRLGYRTRRPQLSSRLRHLLDSHDVVCALTQPIPDAPDGPMQAWLTAPMAGRILGSAIEPDGVVILQLKTLSAVLCIELDEGTEHHPVIIDKLERYAAQLRDRGGWHLLFVVPGRDRLARVRRLAQRPGLAMRGHAWVTLLADVRKRGLNADAYPAWSVDGPVALANLIDDQRDRSSAAPVGSDAWLGMLASGGVEDFDRLLAGSENSVVSVTQVASAPSPDRLSDV